MADRKKGSGGGISTGFQIWAMRAKEITPLFVEMMLSSIVLIIVYFCNLSFLLPVKVFKY